MQIVSKPSLHIIIIVFNRTLNT